jgi:putative transposase
MVKKKVEATRSVDMRKLIDSKDKSIPITRQCELIGISTSAYYYKPKELSKEDLDAMGEIYDIYLEFPYYGSRKMSEELKLREWFVGRKKSRRLMKCLGVKAIYQRPNTSKSNPEHKKYPYLLKGLAINKPNQAWCTDITYIRVQSGWAYLMAVMDWHSRKVISWGLSNTMDVDFCSRVLEEALTHGKPEIFNTDQGSQFTSSKFTDILKREKIKISMDGKGRYLDNILIERFWRSVKYEDVKINNYDTLDETKVGLKKYIHKYNFKRLHQALGYKTPDYIWRQVA